MDFPACGFSILPAVGFSLANPPNPGEDLVVVFASTGQQFAIFEVRQTMLPSTPSVDEILLSTMRMGADYELFDSGVVSIDGRAGVWCFTDAALDEIDVAVACYQISVPADSRMLTFRMVAVPELIIDLNTGEWNPIFDEFVDSIRFY